MLQANLFVLDDGNVVLPLAYLKGSSKRGREITSPGGTKRLIWETK